jgi:aryl-alcohol dehydrogenase-like predicted oxidoreductase
MRYTAFGRSTGLRVSEYALGTANFGTGWGGGAERDASQKMFDRFADAGGTFIDAADIYSNGDSERMLGEFVAADRGHFVLASKYGLSAGNTRISTTGNSRKNMVQSVEASLTRINTDYLDLLWAHWPDPLTPTEEILAGFDHLVRSGKVLHVGLSNFPAWQVAHGAAVAELRGWAPLIGVQFEYSLAERSADRELLPMAHALGLGVTTYSPLGGGLLTGKYRTGDTGRLQDWNGAVLQREDSPQRTAVLDAVLDIAGELEVGPAQVAVAWLLQAGRASASPTVPIIGPRDLAQLDDYLAALKLTLTADQLARLDQVSAPDLGVPHVGAEKNLGGILGGQAALVDRPLVAVV